MKCHGLLSAFAALSVTLPSAAAVEIIAHRGASHDAPENTLAALKLGWEQGADANELDVRLSKDGEVVLMHDATTKRTAGRDQPLTEQTLAELRALDAGRWKGGQWTGETIPTLEEALGVLQDRKQLFIELKSGPEILPRLKEVIAASGKKREQLVIIGFSLPTMREAKQLFPDLPVYWLASPEADKKTGRAPALEELITQAKAAALDGLNLSYKFPIDADFVRKVHAASLKLYVWTVNDAAMARKLAGAGVDGITTDRPAWLREQLR